MLKHTEETIGFFVTFLSLVAFQLEGGGGSGPLGPPSYAYVEMFVQLLDFCLIGLFRHLKSLMHRNFAKTFDEFVCDESRRVVL